MKNAAPEGAAFMPLCHALPRRSGIGHVVKANQVFPLGKPAKKDDAPYEA